MMRKRLVALWVFLATALGSFALTGTDPYWRGGAEYSTAGNSFWLVFADNLGVSPDDPSLKVELTVIADSATTIYVDPSVGGGHLTTITIPAGGGTVTEIIAPITQAYIPLEQAMSPQNTGLHIYSTGAFFHCFGYVEAGKAGATSRDATLLMPDEALGKEYVVQTYPEDGKSTLFVVMATRDNTYVQVQGSTQFYNQQTSATYRLNKGQTVLLPSLPYSQAGAQSIDLSGSTVCATNPIVVFQGNQATKIPMVDAYSDDYTYEQALPIDRLGTEFYLGLAEPTIANKYYVTAVYDNTQVTLTRGRNGSPNVLTFNLSAGQSLYHPTNNTPSVAADLNKNFSNTVVRANRPVMVSSFLTSASNNQVTDGFDEVTGEDIKRNWGDPANAQLIDWSRRLTKVSFVTKELTPEVETYPQHHYVQLVTAWADRAKLKVDGVTVPAAGFQQFAGDATKGYINYELTTAGGHTVTTTGSGFTGMVYGVTEGQSYQYTLGFDPSLVKDSLFMMPQSGAVMQASSYHIDPTPDGSYLRQYPEWEPMHERLDTALVCEEDSVFWLTKLADLSKTSRVLWAVYDLGMNPRSGMHELANDTAGYVPTQDTCRFDYVFRLPRDPMKLPEEQDPFHFFELQQLVWHTHELCVDLEDDVDTLRTILRVNRIYNDTVWRVVCMGDELQFFHDSMPHQGDLTQRALLDSTTTFVADKTAGDTLADFVWKARLGENAFTRRYPTDAGCDSISTLMLFVCDTFRFVETKSLCANEKLVWQGKVYAGPEYSGKYDVRVPAGSSTWEASYKTQWCPCMLESRYPHFEGCDSVHELRLTVHPVYRETVFAETICINEDSTKTVTWHTHVDGLPYDSLIDIFNPGLHHTADGWVGLYADTLHNADRCPECNGGKGCDSIITTRVFFPDAYYVHSYDSYCAGEFDRETLKMREYTYTWQRPDRPDSILTESGVYKERYETAKGCDSTLVLHLKKNMPFYKSDTVYLASGKQYNWNVNYKWYGPYRPTNDSTVIDTIVGQNKAHCDSVHMLVLIIKDIAYGDTVTRSICESDSVHWRGRAYDGFYFADKQEGDSVLKEIRRGTSVFYRITSLVSSSDPQRVRDSIYTLDLTLNRLYSAHTVSTMKSSLELCANDTLRWQDTLYVGEHFIGTLPAGAITHQLSEGNYQFERHWPTLAGCDSVFELDLQVFASNPIIEYDTICSSLAEYRDHFDSLIVVRTPGSHTIQYPHSDDDGRCTIDYTLYLYVLSAHDSLSEATVCQHPSAYYEWEKHHDARTLWDVQRGMRIPSLEIPTNHAGDFYYIDSLTTKPVGTQFCDSVWTLHLHVDSIYLFPEQTLHHCANQQFSWRRYDTLLVAGTHILWDSLSSEVTGCDSVYRMEVVVYPVRDTVLFDSVPQRNPYTYYVGDQAFVMPTEHVDTITRIDTIPSSSGCDSIITFTLRVDSVFTYMVYDTICQGDPYAWDEHPGQGKTYLWDNQTEQRITTIPTDSAGRFFYTDSLVTWNGSDSVFLLNLWVRPVYHIVDTICMSDEEQYRWYDTIYYGARVTAPVPEEGVVKYQGVLADTLMATYFKTDTIGTTYCDSVRYLFLRIGKVFRDTSWVDVCDNYPYDWTRKAIDGVTDSLVKTIPVSDLRTGIFEDQHRTVLNFDSIYYLSMTLHPSFYRDTLDTVCLNGAYTWPLHESRMLWDEQRQQRIDAGAIPTDVSGWFTYRDTIPTATWSCDSVWQLRLYVAPTYLKEEYDSVCDNTPYPWTGHLAADGIHDTIISGLSAGDYTIYDHLKTAIYGCDSTHVLYLHVWPTFPEVAATDTTVLRICENCSYDFYGTTYYGQKSPAIPAGTPAGQILRPNEHVPYMLTFTDHTIHSCDSAVAHLLYVDSTYAFVQETHVCQDTVNTKWEWVDEFGGSHGFYDIRHAGTFFIGDSLKTIHNCDSIFGISLVVDSVYRYDSIYSVCDNDTVSWQHRLYVGPRFYMSVPAADYDSVIYLHRNEQLHLDTITYPSASPLHCDSTFLLQLHVLKTDSVVTKQTVCSGDEDWSFGHDRWRVTMADLHKAYRIDSSVPHRDTIMVWLRDSSLNIHNCDSTTDLTLTLAPSYRFDTTIVTCSNDPAKWRGHDVNVWKSGDYFENYPTATYGCDSTYWLHLEVIPGSVTKTVAHVCRDEAIWWDNQWVEYTSEKNNLEHPNEFVSLENSYKSAVGCDSVLILYPYWHPNYVFYDTLTACDNETFYWYCPSQFGHTGKDSLIIVPPHIGQDTVIVDDSLVTHFFYMDPLDGLYKKGPGCDSIYRLVLVYGSSSLQQDAPMETCWRQPIDWTSHEGHTLYCEEMTTHRKRQLTQLPYDEVGEWFVTDSLMSQVPGGGCDSVWTMFLTVHPAYYDTLRYHLCDNDTMRWQQRLFAGEKADSLTLTIADYILPATDYTFDTLYHTAAFDCDSAFHLALHVTPSYNFVTTDTICRGETLSFYDRLLRTAGTYVHPDYTAEECDSTETLVLSVVEPTHFTTPEVVLCADEDAYTISFVHTGPAPLTYAIHYDEDAAALGFLDAEDQPVYGDTLVLTKPVTGIRENYMRPGRYTASLLFHNGICHNDSVMLVHYEFEVRYPSWITEQHWNDQIAILAPAYNGGYSFESYQWYKDGKELPGETGPYLYNPHLLDTVAEYAVRLKRVGDNEGYMTCPIIPTRVPDRLVPTMPYASVVPAVVSTTNPVVNILSTGTGMYKLYSPGGVLLTQGRIVPDANHAMEIQLPASAGCYIFKLSPDDCEAREAKVIVQ